MSISISIILADSISVESFLRQSYIIKINAQPKWNKTLVKPY